MTKRSKQRDSDPMPYVQVDRAVKPKVAALAAALKVTTHHALGAMVEFWELCGDPRELERLAMSGRGEVVLTRDEVLRRFKLASGGHMVDPADLHALGLLERRGDDLFRVRGMSRYFLPIRRRLHARAIATAGGKARAAGERGEDGRFTGGGAPAGAEAGDQGGPLAGVLAGSGVAADPATPAQVQPTSSQSPTQPSTTAVSGQRSDSRSIVEQARPAGSKEAQEVFECWRSTMGRPLAKFIGKRLKAVERALASGYSVADLKAAVFGASKTAHVNDKGVKFNDLELICRDATYIERFMGAAEGPGAAKSAATIKLVGADLTAIQARERAERESRPDPVSEDQWS